MKTRLDDALTAVTFLGAFALGWTALAETANSTGLFPAPWGGWVWAVVVDSFIWLGARTYRGRDGRWDWYGALMLAAGVLASVGFQAYHAWTLPDAGTAQRGLVAVALVPPLALALAAEAWRRRRQEATAPAAAPVVETSPPPAVQARPTPAAVKPRPRPKPRSSGGKGKRLRPGEAKDAVERVWNGGLNPATGAPWTLGQLATASDVPRATVHRLRKDLEGRRNGSTPAPA